MHVQATYEPATPVEGRAHAAVVEADDAGKTFGSVTALDAVDLEVAEGEIVGIIGPSGAGKTTMIRLLLGLYKPTGGEVQVFGHSAARFSRVERERIGYLPQDFVLYDDLTVRENLAFAAGV
jgi:ABC-type multidrug transport system ATPase subunit